MCDAGHATPAARARASVAIAPDPTRRGTISAGDRFSYLKGACVTYHEASQV
jgi:hypothetical protein